MATLVLKDLIVCKHLLFKGLQELDMFSFFFSIFSGFNFNEVIQFP